MEPKRLNKFISDSGFCSRREADTLIEQGRVTVNGKLPNAGTKVTVKDRVRIDDQTLTVREEEPVFLVFNKPAGIGTSADRSGRNNILAALNYPASLIPIGHLDRDAEGLIFLSNDTELARKMTKLDTQYEKEYLVTVDKPVAGDFLTKIGERGIPNPGAPRKKNFVAKEGANRFRIVLEPGMSHHIKRMCEELGYGVIHLQRTRIHDISTTGLRTGIWRALSPTEIAGLKSVISGKSQKQPYSSKVGRDTFSEEDAPRRASGSERPRNAAASKTAPAKGTNSRIGKSRVSKSAVGPGRAGAKAGGPRRTTGDKPTTGGRTTSTKPSTRGSGPKSKR